MNPIPTFDTDHLRTVAVVGHGAAGKTTLVEQLLAKSGMIGSPGSIEKGTTTTDHDTIEKATGHSLRTAVVHCDVGHTRVHVIDTPGYPDFIGPSIAALHAVETVVVVVNAAHGIELVTRRMMDLAKERGLCRMMVVNKIDLPNVDLPRLLAELRETFGPEVLPINLPANGGTRVIDCFDQDHGTADFLSVRDVHRQVMEQIVEVDDAAMERYLEDGAADPRTLHAPLEKALREGHLVPVCFVSAKSGAGVQDLLDVLVRHLPSPKEGNPPLFAKGDRTYRTTADPEGHLVAHVFQVAYDPYVGRVAMVRVHQGCLRRDMVLFVGGPTGEGRRSIKVGHVHVLQGKEMKEVAELVPGDIGAIAKVEDLAFDKVLHDSHEEDMLVMRPLSFPRPMLGWAIEPRRRGDEGKMSDVLAKLAAEDPTLTIEQDAEQNETVMRGLSELHLRTALRRASELYHLEVSTRTPKVPYRETIVAAANGHARHKKQTGGAGQFGEVMLKVEPLDRGEGFVFVDEVKGGVIPHNLIPAVEKGVREVLASGHAAGYPLVDLRVTVYDGKHHPVDSKEVAFVAAARKAMRNALDQAGVVVLEPIVTIEVTAPDGVMGSVTGDLASRRAQIRGTHNLPGAKVVVTATVPLSEIDDYTSRLDGLTHGAGTYSLTLSHYDRVPARVQEERIAAYVRTRSESDED